MSHGLADYLDGYNEFLDDHDRRALGMAVQPQNSTRAGYAPAAMRVGVQQYAVVQPAPQRLQAQLIARGRVVSVPFGLSTPTALSPGSAPIGSPASMPMTNMVSAPPPTLNPTTYGPAAVPAGGGSGGGAPTFYPDVPNQTPGGAAAGGSGLVSGSVWGWLLMAAGGYWMYKNL